MLSNQGSVHYGVYTVMYLKTSRNKSGQNYVTYNSPIHSSTCFFIAVLLVLLLLLRLLLLFQRRVELQYNQQQDILPEQLDYTQAALVTLADPSFQNCAVQLVKSARQYQWNGPIFLLSIDYDKFDLSVLRSFTELGVFIIRTNPYFDPWIKRQLKLSTKFRPLDYRKFRKLELFLNPIFRTYKRLIYIDADGVIASDLAPLINVRFPEGSSIIFRQNDKAVGKETLWGNEIATDFLSKIQIRHLRLRYPDRWKAGASCWFMVNMKILQPPDDIFQQSLDIIRTFQSAFKLNDQTLLNLLFYDQMAIFPWCVWDEVSFVYGEKKMREFCNRHMHLQRWIKGSLKFMYRHMSIEEKKQCIRTKK